MLHLRTALDAEQLINFPQTFTNHFKKHLDPSRGDLVSDLLSIYTDSVSSCRRCGGGTEIQTRQTRGADEGMAMFVYCRSCKYKIQIDRYEPKKPYELCILMENQTQNAIKIIAEVCFQGLLADLACMITSYVGDHIATLDCKQLIYSRDIQILMQELIQNIDQIKQCRNFGSCYKPSWFSNIWCASEANLMVYIVYSTETKNKNFFLTSQAKVNPFDPQWSEPSSGRCSVCAPYCSLFARLGTLNLNLHSLCQKNCEKRIYEHSTSILSKSIDSVGKL